MITCYKDETHGVKVGEPYDVITDPQRGVLVTDCRNSQVLLLRRTGDVEKILLDKHVRSPRVMYLDTDHHRLYVSGINQRGTCHVLVFNYTLLTGDKKLTMKVTKLDMKVEI